jgi:hypothetical protein
VQAGAHRDTISPWAPQNRYFELDIPPLPDQNVQIAPRELPAMSMHSPELPPNCVGESREDWGARCVTPGTRRRSTLERWRRRVGPAIRDMRRPHRHDFRQLAAMGDSVGHLAFIERHGANIADDPGDDRTDD